MDPAAEIRDSKRTKEYINMLSSVADSEYGIPTRCPCGGSIIHEVRRKDEYDTLPGKRFFTMQNYSAMRLFLIADGFHYRQPWVHGVEEQIERLTKRLAEVEVVINWVPEVDNHIQRLEAEVKDLTREVDYLTGQVYNLSIQVEVLEKLCFD
ncbi:hypothetical protein Bca52824_051387 [Brassica carinata]|uniref:Uncharacterized protein n=1 Tax=Brassica carinata TaxID=52824 RepID=A0A8X7R2B2_BRACI|nr:hypothetical protein Bca52824_051387 [Brassica carinata]